jgi:Kef-type K+ transport system membrane component KefB
VRRAATLFLLLFAMQLLLPLGAAGSSASLLTFGFLILAAYTVGEIATAARLPKIVGYLAAGALFGPSVLNIVTRAATNELAPVSQLAIALIAFLAGAELQWSEVRTRGGTIGRVLGAELLLSFAAIFTLLFAVRGWVPFLQNADTMQTVVLAALFASIAIVHSPAVTIALLTETQAHGEVARTTLGVVLVADVVVVLLFSGMLSLAQTLVPPPGGQAGASLALVAWEIGGSVLVGAALGAVVALYLRFVQRELFLFAIVATFFGAEIARIAHVETLLTLVVAGFVTENSTRHEGAALRHAMERSAAPVFVVFFALAGAKMELAVVATLLPLVIPIVAVRALGIWAGATLGGRWAGVAPASRRHLWKGLISQAGVAIGLATLVAEAYPLRGAQIRTLFLAVIAVNETIGPILFRHALVRSGEAAEPTGSTPSAPAGEPDALPAPGKA